MEYKWAEIKWALTENWKQTKHVLIIECATEQQQQPQPKRRVGIFAWQKWKKRHYYTVYWWSCCGGSPKTWSFGVHDAGRPIVNISPPSQNYSRIFASPVSSVATASAADTTTITTATFFQVNE